MHYANGQEAKAGDLVIKFRKPETASDMETIGILRSATAQTESCNGQMIPLARRVYSDAGLSPWIPVIQGYPDCVTLGELLPVTAESPAKPE